MKDSATQLPPLYLITDRCQVPGGDLNGCLAAALSAGVQLVQLREKDLSVRDLLALARQVRALTQKFGAKLLINSRADVALAVGADGVHLPSHSPPVDDMRKMLGEHALIGVSTHSATEVEAARTSGADFVTFGPIFDTPSKRGMGSPTGVAALKKVVGHTVPVFALGGIHLPQLPAVMDSGCHGVAMISELMAAANPEQAARALVAAIGSGENL